jgi:hypothetical protein
VVSEGRRWLRWFLILRNSFAWCLGWYTIYGPLHDSIIRLKTMTTKIIFSKYRCKFIFYLSRGRLMISHLLLHLNINFYILRIIWFISRRNKRPILYNIDTYAQIYMFFFCYKWLFIFWIWIKIVFFDNFTFSFNDNALIKTAFFSFIISGCDFVIVNDSFGTVLFPNLV